MYVFSCNKTLQSGRSDIFSKNIVSNYLGELRCGTHSCPRMVRRNVFLRNAL